MAEAPTWEVDFLVDGPVVPPRRFHTTKQKGFRPENPFYSDIEIARVPSGLRVTITARAPNEQLAREAATFFFGRMLDVLAFNIDRPLFLSLTESERRPGANVRHHTRRNIERQEINDAFREADHLSLTDPAFLRSLSWFRKGLYTDDPFDKFFAFWNVIEIIAANYYQSVPEIDQERAKNGSKSQIWECFKALWGSCEQWPNIPGDDKWIDENYDIRKNIAHGVRSVEIGEVAVVVDELETIQRVAQRFLQDWRDEFLYADLDPSSPKLPDSDEETLRS